MSAYPPHIQALMDEALAVGIGDYAARLRLHLRPAGGIDRAGPCPIVGGTDGFSINTVKNVWRCRRCGVAGGDVISFAMHVHACDFKSALEQITGRHADDLKAETDAQKAEREKRMAAQRARAEQDARKREAEADRYRQEARKDAYRIWRQGARVSLRDRDGLVVRYLRARGIDTEHLIRNSGGGTLYLREHPELPYTHKVGGQWQTIHTGPAMLAPMIRADGKFGGVHRTWIDLDNPPKFKARIPDPERDCETLDPKKMRGSKRTAAIPLYTPADAERIVGGEGIETTATVMVSCFEPKTAYWALLDLGHMAGRAFVPAGGKRLSDVPDPEDTDAFLPPEWCRELVFLGDADQGDERARRKIHDELTRGCRRAMAARPGLVAKIAWAATGMDFNDMAGV